MGLPLRVPIRPPTEPACCAKSPALRLVSPTSSRLAFLLRRLDARSKRWVVYGLAVVAAVSSGTMSFLDHLEELRKRLIASLVAVMAGVVVVAAFIDPIVAFVMRPLQEILPPGGQLIYTEPAEAFFVQVKIAILAGVGVAAPVVFHQLWLFVAPGLYAHEKKLAIPFVALSTTCFIGGALFAHFVVFPIAWSFFAGFETDFMAFTPRISAVFSLYTRLLLAFAIVFQMPTLALFLARVGVLTPRMMVTHGRYAIVGVFIVAAVVTPPDPTSQLLTAGPMLLLYVLCIGIAWAFGPRDTEDQ